MDTASLYKAARPRYPELSGRTAVVTGSSKGIGKGIAVRLAREGMKVVINGRSADSVEATAAELRALGAEALGVAADVGLSESVDTLFREALARFGSVDLLVNNAANLARFHFFEVNEELLDAELAANVRGPYLCAIRAAESMRDRGTGGSIINISSVAGARAHWRGLPYDVTKGAIDSMTRSMALELAKYGIRVNAVAPGATATERTEAANASKIEALTRRIPIPRLGLALEVGAAVAFLASEEAAYILGQVMYVDGGLTVQLGTPEQPT
jgi:NAD(P)-dependent dehydrogenase (short-subunit alcohol dehydrogenase family)